MVPFAWRPGGGAPSYPCRRYELGKRKICRRLVQLADEKGFQAYSSGDANDGASETFTHPTPEKRKRKLEP